MTSTSVSLPSIADLQQRLKEIILSVCDVKDVSIDQVDSHALLFNGDGPLQLDSLDAVEIAMAVHREFGVKIKDASSAKSAFRSVAALAEHIVTHGTPASQARP